MWFMVNFRKYNIFKLFGIISTESHHKDFKNNQY